VQDLDLPTIKIRLHQFPSRRMKVSGKQVGLLVVTFSP
jgi:hypothetical protein